MKRKKVIEDGIEYLVEEQDGVTCWFHKEQLHRLGDYAVLYSTGEKSWWLKGKLVYNDYYDKRNLFEMTDKFKLSIVKHVLRKA